jgi:hypothetical protein
MTRFTAKWFIGLALIGLVVSLPLHVAAQQAADETRTAHGTWHVSDGKASDTSSGSSSGSWQARYRVDAAGALDGTIAFTGMGESKPAAIVGRVDGDRISFGGVSRKQDDSAAAEPVWDFDGVIRGAQIKGTFVDAAGRTGEWDGWWTVSERERKAREQTDAAVAR